MKKFQFLILFASLVLPLFSAMAQNECKMPAEQGRGSLLSAWSHLPISLVLDQSFYLENSGADALALKRAAATWNEWAKQKGLVAFEIVDDGLGMDIPDLLNSCSQWSYTNAIPQSVGVWKINGVGKRANIRASCSRDAQGNEGKLLSMGAQGQTDWMTQGGQTLAASVLLNFEDYNSPGRQKVDVESVFLHELGHVLGLLHSCSLSNFDGTAAPRCFDGAPQSYLDAVMFPVVREGEIKRQLGQNDIDRVNCLY